MVFPVVMYGCESWTMKKAECRRIDAFELWCWRRFLRVPWTVRRSNESILKEISPGCSLVGPMLKLKLQYFGHLMWRADSFEKTLMLGDWGQEEKGTAMDEMVGWHHQLNGHRFGWTLGVDDGQGGLACCCSWGRNEWNMTEWMNWTELNWTVANLDQDSVTGTSLMAQWWRLQAPNAGVLGLSLGEGTIPHAATKNSHDTTKNPTCWN